MTSCLPANQGRPNRHQILWQLPLRSELRLRCMPRPTDVSEIIEDEMLADMVRCISGHLQRVAESTGDNPLAGPEDPDWDARFDHELGRAVVHC